MAYNLQLTLKIKLQPTKDQKSLIEHTMANYIATVNNIAQLMVSENNLLKLSSKDVVADLPSALRGQCILDAKSIFKRYKKACKSADQWNKKHPSEPPKTANCPVLRKPVAIWNNQNFSVTDNTISFPVLIDGKCTRINVKAYIPAETLQRIQSNKLGTFRISKKNNKIIGQIAIAAPIGESLGHSVMGVDLGLKIPAVCATDEGKVKFVGNGRKNKYIRRMFRSKRKRLGKAKKLNAIRKNTNKEQRIMQDIDHKLSREIVDFAKDNNVSTINLEQLKNIRMTAKTSRKNEKNLHTWSFYRLAMYIEYKAMLVGIKVQYIDPAYTSQHCPICGTKNHARDRKYSCKCGYKGHRDIVGARNIIKAPVMDGNSPSA